jgi:hypothetical protein
MFEEISDVCIRLFYFICAVFVVLIHMQLTPHP